MKNHNETGNSARYGPLTSPILSITQILKNRRTGSKDEEVKIILLGK